MVRPGLIIGVDENNKMMLELIKTKINNIDHMIRLYSTYIDDPEKIKKEGYPQIVRAPNATHPLLQQDLQKYNIVPSTQYSVVPTNQLGGNINYKYKYEKYRHKYNLLKKS